MVLSFLYYFFKIYKFTVHLYLQNSYDNHNHTTVNKITIWDFSTYFSSSIVVHVAGRHRTQCDIEGFRINSVVHYPSLAIK